MMHDVTMRGRQLLFDHKSTIERRMTLSTTATATAATATDAATAALRCIHGASTGSIASGYCICKEIRESEREKRKGRERDQERKIQLVRARHKIAVH